MKRITLTLALAIIAGVLLAAGLVACGGGDGPNKSAEKEAKANAEQFAPMQARVC